MQNKCHSCGHEVKQCTGEGLIHYKYDNIGKVHMFTIECLECYCVKPALVIKCEDVI